MSTAAWVLLGVGAWVCVAVVVALLIGRVVRLRDRQAPRPDPPPSPPGRRDAAGPPTGRGPTP